MFFEDQNDVTNRPQTAVGLFVHPLASRLWQPVKIRSESAEIKGDFGEGGTSWGIGASLIVPPLAGGDCWRIVA